MAHHGVSIANGSPVRLGDLGRVVDDVQDNRAASWFNGTRAIMLADGEVVADGTVHAVLDDSATMRRGGLL